MCGTPHCSRAEGVVTASGQPHNSKLPADGSVGDVESSSSLSAPITGSSHAVRCHPRDRRVAHGVAVLVLISGLISALAAPGTFTPDSLDQYNQALNDMYTDWHTPILTGLWGFLNTPPEFVLLLFVTMVMVSSALLLISETTVRWAVVAVTLAALWPMTFEGLVTIGKDAWFAGFFLAGAALSAQSVPYQGRRRIAAFAAVGALWWLAVAARPNAVVPVFLVVTFGWPLTVGVEQVGWWSLSALKRIGLAGAFALGIVVSQSAYTSIVVQPTKTHPEQPTYQFDLVGLSLRTGEMLIPSSSLRPGADLETLGEHWNHAEGGGLWFAPDAPVAWALPPEQVGELRRAWIDSIEEHPLQYLQHRARFGLAFLGLSEPSYGVFNPTTSPAGWGFDYSLTPEFAPWFRSWFHETFVEGGVLCWFRQWMFIAVLVGVGLSPRGRSSIAVRSLLAAGVGSTCSFLLAASSATFRYAWFTMVCSLLAAAIGLYWITDWLRSRWRREAPNLVPIA